MTARLVALLAAVAMVAGAYAVRNRDDAPASPGEHRGDALRVVCADELADVCRPGLGDGFAVAVEPATQTLADLVSKEGDESGIVWITPGPWPQMVDEARRGKPDLFPVREAVATAQLVAVVREDRPVCNLPEEPLEWRCLGDAGSSDAGAGVAAPSSQGALRHLIRAAALGARVGRADYATNDVLPEHVQWLDAFDRGVDDAASRGAGDLARFFLVPAARAFLTSSAEAGAPPRGFVVAPPQPGASFAVWVGAKDRGQLQRVLDAGLVDRLAEARYAPGRGGEQGLPSPGVLFALATGKLS